MQVKQGDNLVVVTQPITQIVDSVKVQDQRGVIKELESLGNNVYSLAGIPVGNYILDVVVDLGSNKKGAYETILVILEQGQPPIQPAQIINRFKTSTDISIIFDNGDNNTNGNQTGDGCEPGFVLVGDNCEPVVCHEYIGNPCPNPPVVESPVIDGNETVIPEEPIVEEPEFPEEPDQPVEGGDQGGGDNGNDNNDNGNNDESEPEEPEENGGLAGVPPFG